MNVGPKFDGKRDLLAYGLQWSGILFMLSQLQARDSLLVLNYHRIGDPEKDPWDPGMFSATREQFDEQISYLKRNHSLVTLDEALAFVGGTSKEKTRRCRVPSTTATWTITKLLFLFSVRMECKVFSFSARTRLDPTTFPGGTTLPIL